MLYGYPCIYFQQALWDKSCVFLLLFFVFFKKIFVLSIAIIQKNLVAFLYAVFILFLCHFYGTTLFFPAHTRNVGKSFQEIPMNLPLDGLKKGEF